MATTASSRPSRTRSLVDEVVESVAVLAEDDQLPPLAMRVEHLRRVLQQVGQLLPLAVGTAAADLSRKLFESREGLDLVFELGDRARRGGLVD